MSQQEKQDLADAEAVCRRFLAWDLDATLDETTASVKQKLALCLGLDHEAME